MPLGRRPDTATGQQDEPSRQLISLHTCVYISILCLGTSSYRKVCFVFIAIALPFLEGARPFEALPNLGWHILLLNGLVAFALNVSSVLLIRSSGSVVSSLSGVLKVLSIRWVLATLISQDIILIFFSVVLLGSAISLQQICGEQRVYERYDVAQD